MKSHSMSEWLQQVKQFSASKEQIQDVIEQDLYKWSRLKQLNEQIDLPIEKHSHFEVDDFISNSKRLQEFFNNSKSDIYSIKAEPKKEFEDTLFRNRKHRLTKEQAIEFVKNLKPSPEHYKAVSSWDCFITDLAGVLVVNNDGIILEVTRGSHSALTQGSNDTKVITGYLDFKTNELEIDNSVKEIAQLAIDKLTADSKTQFPTANNKIKGYFEFLYSKKGGFAFIDFSTTKIMNNVQWTGQFEKGMTASKGTAAGKAKIVLSEDDFYKVQEGDIVVTKMTDPSFVPILSKASALITEYGGLLCHAAIVARELDIPCITNLKDITTTLKDNDQIEVDADNAVVKL